MKPVENEELIEADIIRVFFHSENETFLQRKRKRH